MMTSINLYDLNKILQAVSECSGMNCEECREKLQTGPYCPITNIRYQSVANAAHEFLNKYFELDESKIEVNEDEFLNLLFTDGDFQ